MLNVALLLPGFDAMSRLRRGGGAAGAKIDPADATKDAEATARYRRHCHGVVWSRRGSAKFAKSCVQCVPESVRGPAARA